LFFFGHAKGVFVRSVGFLVGFCEIEKDHWGKGGNQGIWQSVRAQFYGIGMEEEMPGHENRWGPDVKLGRI
jgi:hypothetical protein